MSLMQLMPLNPKQWGRQRQWAGGCWIGASSCPTLDKFGTRNAAIHCICTEEFMCQRLWRNETQSNLTAGFPLGELYWVKLILIRKFLLQFECLDSSSLSWGYWSPRALTSWSCGSVRQSPGPGLSWSSGSHRRGSSPGTGWSCPASSIYYPTSDLILF